MKFEVVYTNKVTDFEKSICESYWKTNDITGKFFYSLKEISININLTTHIIRNTVKENSYLLLSDVECVCCSGKKICYTRTDMTNSSNSKWICKKCILKRREERERKLQAEIEAAEKKQAEEKELKKRILERLKYEKTKNTPSLNELSIVNHYLLVCVIESLGLDDLSGIVSLSENTQQPLTPHFKLDIRVLEALYNDNLLYINEESFEHVKIINNNVEINYFNCSFRFSYDKNQLNELYENSHKNKYKTLLANEKIYKDWVIEISIAECVSYLIDQCNEYQIYPTIQEKIEGLIKLSLQDLTVSEVWFLIWVSIRDTAIFSKKSHVTKNHANNSVYTIIKNNFESMKNGNKKKSSFNRIKKHPQSVISQKFIDLLFESKDSGLRVLIPTLSANLNLKNETDYRRLGGVSLQLSNKLQNNDLSVNFSNFATNQPLIG